VSGKDSLAEKKMMFKKIIETAKKFTLIFASIFVILYLSSY
jgi:hypothetical protein